MAQTNNAHHKQGRLELDVPLRIQTRLGRYTFGAPAQKQRPIK